MFRTPALSHNHHRPQSSTMSPSSYRHLLVSSASNWNSNCTMHDPGSGDSIAELRFSGRTGSGSLIIWDRSSTLEVKKEGHGTHWTLLGSNGKGRLATATSGKRKSERVVKIDMGKSSWELVSGRSRMRKRWDLYKLSSGYSKKGSKHVRTTKKREDLVGEVVGHGWRNGEHAVYVREDLPMEIVAFAAWMVRKGAKGDKRAAERGG